MNKGHGHVTPRADGVKARCGGPNICKECALELAASKLQKPEQQSMSDMAREIQEVASRIEQIKAKYGLS